MYNDANRKAQDTLASVIRNSYLLKDLKLSEEVSEYASIVRLCDALDYSRVNFNKSIRTFVEKQVVFDSSKYSIYTLEDLIYINRWSINPDKTPDKKFIYVDISAIEKRTGVINYTNVIYGGNAPTRARRIAHKNSIVLSTVRPNLRGFAFLLEEPPENTVFSTGFDIIEVRNESMLAPYYLYLLFQSSDALMQQIMAKMGKGQYPSINGTDIKSLKISIPPISVQQKIIDECKECENEYNSIRMNISTFQQRISDIFVELENATQEYRLNLSDTEKFDVFIGPRVLTMDLILEGIVPVFSANVMEPFGYVNRPWFEDFSKDSVLWGIDGDWMVRFYQKNQPFYPTDHCGVLRILTDEVHPRYMAHILEAEGKRINFSRSYRASIDRIKSITFTVPEISLQNKAMEKVIDLENKIKIAEQKLSTLIEKRRTIIQDFL